MTGTVDEEEYSTSESNGNDETDTDSIITSIFTTLGRKMTRHTMSFLLLSITRNASRDQLRNAEEDLSPEDK